MSRLGRAVSKLFGRREKQSTTQRRSYGAADPFVFEGEFLPCSSSNVAAAQYHVDASKLMVEFLNGSAYLYYPISVDKAAEFYNAGSKGGWCWTNLRVRGPGGDHLTAPGITCTRIR